MKNLLVAALCGLAAAGITCALTIAAYEAGYEQAKIDENTDCQKDLDAEPEKAECREDSGTEPEKAECREESGIGSNMPVRSRIKNFFERRKTPSTLGWFMKHPEKHQFEAHVDGDEIHVSIRPRTGRVPRRNKKLFRKKGGEEK